MHYLTNTLVILLAVGLGLNEHYCKHTLQGKLRALELLAEGKKRETRPAVLIILILSFLYSTYYYLGL